MNALFFVLILAQAFSRMDNDGLIRHYQWDHSGTFDTSDAVVVVDFDRAPAATYVSEVGAQTFTAQNGGAYNIRVNDGTWPNGLSGTQGTGWANTYVGGSGLTQADSAWQESNDFSVVCAVTPWTSSGDQFIVSKTLDAPNRSWAVQGSGSTLYFYVTNDGAVTGQSTLTKAAAFLPNVQTFFAVTYHYVTDGTSQARAYVNDLAVASDDTFKGPPTDGSAPFNFFARGDGFYGWNGIIHKCAYYHRAIDAAEYETLRRQWFGLQSSSGRLPTVTAAAPWSVLSGAKFIKPPANNTIIGSPASGSGGIYAAVGRTNTVTRGGYETCTVADTPDGWTKAETGGSAITCVTHAADHYTVNDAIQGQSHVRFTVTDGGTATLTSSCMTTNNKAAIYESVYFRRISGNTECHINHVEYDNADCTTELTVDEDTAIGTSSSWIRKWVAVTAAHWENNTSSYKFQINCHDEGVIEFDGVMVYGGTVPTDGMCVCDTDTSCVCSTTQIEIGNPLGSSIWGIDATVRYPRTLSATGSPSGVFFSVPKTSGSQVNAIWLGAGDQSTWAGNGYALVGDQSDGYNYRTVAATSENTDTRYLMSHRSDGSWLLWQAGVAAGAAAGAGTGLLTTMATTAYIGYSSTQAPDAWVRNLKFWRRAVAP